MYYLHSWKKWKFYDWWKKLNKVIKWHVLFFSFHLQYFVCQDAIIFLGLNLNFYRYSIWYSSLSLNFFICPYSRGIHWSVLSVRVPRLLTSFNLVVRFYLSISFDWKGSYFYMMSLVGAQVKLREMKPGMLSQELKEALGMPEGAPPPWLINMQVIL